MKEFSISADTQAHLDLLITLQEHYNDVCNLIEGESQELDEAFLSLRVAKTEHSHPVERFKPFTYEPKIGLKSA